MKLYVASSWKNPTQPTVVAELREAGHEVYDFRNPAPGDSGFSWSEIDPDWQLWTREQYREALQHPAAERGFRLDVGGMLEAAACVLLLPSGRSAHIEAGWFAGAGRPVVVLLDDASEPELMYLLTAAICVSVSEVLEVLTELVCRKCGCTDVRPCSLGCGWAEPGLCDRCALAELQVPLRKILVVGDGG